jgi:hypothetical protein
MRRDGAASRSACNNTIAAGERGAYLVAILS